MISNYHTTADPENAGGAQYSYKFDDNDAVGVNHNTKKNGKKKSKRWGRPFGRGSKSKISPSNSNGSVDSASLGDKHDSLSYSTDNSSHYGQDSTSSSVFQMLEDEVHSKIPNQRNNNNRYNMNSSAHSVASSTTGAYSTDGSLLGTKLVPSSNTSVASSSYGGSLQGERFLQDLGHGQSRSVGGGGGSSSSYGQPPRTDYPSSNTSLASDKKNKKIVPTSDAAAIAKQQQYHQQKREQAQSQQAQKQQQEQQQQNRNHQSRQNQILDDLKSSSAKRRASAKREIPVITPADDDVYPTLFCGLELPQWLVLSI